MPQIVRSERFRALSLKALYQVVPHMERGQRYDEACVLAGYHHTRHPGNARESARLRCGIDSRCRKAGS